MKQTYEQTKNGWDYGYINQKTGEFVKLTSEQGKKYNDPARRPVFYNSITGQVLPYNDVKHGAPGSNYAEQVYGIQTILEYLENGENSVLHASDKEREILNNFLAYNEEQGNQIFLDAPKPGVDSETDTEQAAFNQYYNDLYSLNKGTSGAKMYDRLTQSYQNQAAVASTLAEAQYQQQAMQQAQVVKQITDQVRTERMARLKAGMSEAQIANQDMQMMMTNVNALNQNNAMLNQARLEATGAMMTAQDQAYADYLNQANARGQVAMAGYATDAGNVAYQVSDYLAKNPGTTYANAYKIVTGQNK